MLSASLNKTFPSFLPLKMYRHTCISCVYNYPNFYKLYYNFIQTSISGVTESLLGGGAKGEARHSFAGGGGGEGSIGRHRSDFFLITFIVHNEKS